MRAIIATARDDLDVIACELAAAAPATRNRPPSWRRALSWLAAAIAAATRNDPPRGR